MTIEIGFNFSNGSCWCGPTACHLLLVNGEIAIDKSDGNYDWQVGRATAHREYGQYFRGASRLQRWSRSKFFARLPEEAVREYVLALVFLGETMGRKSPSFWRLCKNGELTAGYANAVSITK